MSAQPAVVVTEKCAICLASIKRLSLPDSCSHRFCYECIKAWSESALRCPLCQKEFKSLQVSKTDGTEEFQLEVLQQPKKTVIDTSRPDFECLNDSYFLTEIDRLLKNAEKAKKEVFGASKKRQDDYGYSRLQEVIERLKKLETVMKSDSRFNPNTTLTELYQIDFMLQILWTGSSELLVSIPSTSASSTTQQRFGADDAFNEEYDDDYDEYDNYDDGYDEYKY